MDEHGVEAFATRFEATGGIDSTTLERDPEDRVGSNRARHAVETLVPVGRCVT